MTRHRMPVPELPGVQIEDTGDGIIIRTVGAPDVDEGLKQMGRREGVA